MIDVVKAVNGVMPKPKHWTKAQTASHKLDVEINRLADKLGDTEVNDPKYKEGMEKLHEMIRCRHDFHANEHHLDPNQILAGVVGIIGIGALCHAEQFAVIPQKAFGVAKGLLPRIK